MAIKRHLTDLDFNKKVKRRKIYNKQFLEFYNWIQSEKQFINKFIQKYIDKFNKNPNKVLKCKNKNNIEKIKKHFRFLVLHNSGFTNKVLDSIIYKNIINSFCFKNYILSPIKNIEKLKEQHGEEEIKKILIKFNIFKFTLKGHKIESQIILHVEFMNFNFLLRLNKEKYSTINDFKNAIKKHFYHPSNSKKKIIIFEKKIYVSIMNSRRIINRVLNNDEKISDKKYYFIKFEE